MVTTAILLWTHEMRLSGDLHGLATSFFVLFAHNDYPGAVCTLLVLVGALFGSRYLPARRIVQWAGDRPMVIAVIAVPLLALGTLIIYHNHPLAMDEYAAYFQSSVFAAGQLHGSFPSPLLDSLIPPGMQVYFLNMSPAPRRASETYLPGFAPLTTPFIRARVTW